LPSPSVRGWRWLWYNCAMSRKSDDKRPVADAELMAIVEAQGVKPPDFDQIMSGEPIVPDDETADMMIEAIYGWRKEGTDRSLP
jgi:hypothetical protein